MSLPWWWLPIFAKMDKPTRCRNLLPRYFPASCTRRKMATTQKSCDGRKSTSSTWFPELSTVLAKKSRCPSTSIYRQSNYNNTDTKQKLFPLWWSRWHRLFSGRTGVSNTDSFFCVHGNPKWGTSIGQLSELVWLLCWEIKDLSFIICIFGINVKEIWV